MASAPFGARLKVLLLLDSEPKLSWRYLQEATLDARASIKLSAQIYLLKHFSRN
jgi:hypothetical protein